MKRLSLAALVVCLVLAFAVFAQAQTCQYQTNWGVLVIINQGSTVTGSYPGGTITGYMNYPYINGNWYGQSTSGSYSFTLYQGGFNGSYNLVGDIGWRGNWGGTLISCY